MPKIKKKKPDLESTPIKSTPQSFGVSRTMESVEALLKAPATAPHTGSFPWTEASKFTWNQI